MSSDIYTAVSGATAGWTQLDTIANNLANTNTTGFRSQLVRFESQQTDPNGHQVQAQVETRLSEQGPILHDGVSTHLALSGSGFFQVQGETEALMVRSGQFQLNVEGALVDRSGRPVLGEGGPIVLDPDEGFSFGSDGAILDGQGSQVDRLRLVTSTMVEPAGGSAYRPLDKVTPAEDTTVTAGALEGSSVDPMREMVSLIETTRLFEMYQKSIETSDELDGRANQLGGAG